MISKTVTADLEKYRAVFTSARPFRHVVIEDFLEPDFAELLLRDFPSFDKEKALNEVGNIGRKAVHENLKEISSFYTEFSDYVTSPDFLSAVSKITGIDDLQADESQFGGGTHENLDGQWLAPHVDFNYDETRWVHRRLNLLLYLNKEWETSWGGSIELHSNPRRPEEDVIKAVLPSFNRCLIFETNEYSWHGFPAIHLPPDKQHLSRKSVSIYLYTKERPEEEIAPSHGTFYVQRPLPEYIKEGHTLTSSDIQLIRELMLDRDGWIEFYQYRELDSSRLLRAVRDNIAEMESSLRLPIVGYALQQGQTKGYWADGWVAINLRLQVKLEKNISRIQVFGYVPDFCQPGNEVRITANTFSGNYVIGNTGTFDIELPVELEEGTVIDLSIDSKESISGLRAGINQDGREGAFLLNHISFE